MAGGTGRGMDRWTDRVRMKMRNGCVCEQIAGFIETKIRKKEKNCLSLASKISSWLDLTLLSLCCDRIWNENGN